MNVHEQAAVMQHELSSDRNRGAVCAVRVPVAGVCVPSNNSKRGEERNCINNSGGVAACMSGQTSACAEVRAAVAAVEKEIVAVEAEMYQPPESRESESMASLYDGNWKVSLEDEDEEEAQLVEGEQNQLSTQLGSASTSCMAVDEPAAIVQSVETLASSAEKSITYNESPSNGIASLSTNQSKSSSNSNQQNLMPSTNQSLRRAIVNAFQRKRSCCLKKQWHSKCVSDARR